MAERKEAYSAAHVTIGVDDRSRYELVGELRRRWLAWQRAHHPPDRRRPAATMTVATRWLRAGGRARAAAGRAGRAGANCRERSAEVGFDGRLFVVADEHAMAAARRAAASGAARCAAAVHLRRRSRQDARAGRARSGTGWSSRARSAATRWSRFGGGVVCDMVGFAAACYLRGIGLVNAPTTLLAQVDAAVGGKTGVNHPRGKNLIGAFYQPLCVVADTGLLATLSPRAFARRHGRSRQDGHDPRRRAVRAARSAWPHGSAASDGDALAPIVARSIELKADIVERDERESGDRMLLNYGHTVGHALEAGAGYGALLHGEAVAVGMQAAAHIALRLDMLTRRRCAPADGAAGAAAPAAALVSRADGRGPGASRRSTRNARAAASAGSWPSESARVAFATTCRGDRARGDRNRHAA